MRRIAIFLLPLLLLPFVLHAAEVKSLDNAQLNQILAENKGKVIMLNFFATWCPPCKAEIPEIVKLRSAFPVDKLLVLGLAVDVDKAPVGPFVDKLAVNYPVYLATGSITDAYNVTSVPHNTFFAPDGRIVVSAPGMAELPVLRQLVNDLLR